MRVAETLKDRIGRPAKVSEILLHPNQYERQIRPVSVTGLLIWKETKETTPKLYVPSPEFAVSIDELRRPRVIDIYHLYGGGTRIPVFDRRFADKDIDETIQETYVKATGHLKRDQEGHLYLNTWWKPIPVHISY